MRLNHPNIPGTSIEVDANRVDSHLAAGWLRDESATPEGPKQEETHISTDDVDPASGEESEED